MKLIFRDNENDIVLSPDWITILEVANRKLFSSYVRSLYSAFEGELPERDVFLFQDNKELKIQKEIMYVSDLLSIDYNSRMILTALQKKVEEIKNNEIELWQKNEDIFMSFSESIIQFFNEINLDLDFNFKFDVPSVLKILNIRIQNSDKGTHLDKLLKLVEILSELRIFSVIVLVNLKSVLDIDELNQFYKYCMYKKFCVLLIESRIEECKLPYERKIIIDSDFDEYLV